MSELIEDSLEMRDKYQVEQPVTNHWQPPPLM
jgi:hypothetical protein